MSEKIITLFLCVLSAALLIVGGILYVFSDREGPEITLNESIVSFTEGQDESVLLEGVKAYDKKDLDVSDTLIVESVLPLLGKDKVKIVYAASDRSDNITKVDIIIDYYTADATSAEPADEGTEADQQGEEGNAQEDQPENSGDVENTEDSPLVSSGAPVIRLNKTQATVSVGSQFNAASYVEQIVDDKDDEYDLFRKIQLGGDYKQGFTNSAGTYNIIFYVLDSDGNQSNEETLVLLVQ